jgi:protein-disulfide isomerase
MKNALLFGAAGMVVAAGMLSLGFYAGRPNPGAAGGTIATLEAMDRGQVEKIVREYLIANPEVLVEAQTALEDKQKEQQRVAQLAVIENSKADIFNAKYDGVVGNPDGKITVVEFYDYNCGFCKRALPDMQAMTQNDPDLRFVLKEFPILGVDSQKAHVVSMAFHRLAPEKYGEFHTRLLGGQGHANEAIAIKIALDLGADETRLREEMKNPAITEAFSQTYDLANKLAITGTPSYVVGKEVVFGALGREVLSEKVAAVREACSQAAC